jgi:phosphoenolpyruvate carboxykinase (GTP)
LKHPPQVFHVNWFRRNENDEFLWPGFGQNVRVLMWMLERINGGGKAVETPIGYVPTLDGLDLDGVSVTPEQLEELLAVKPAEWEQEWADQRPFFEQFGETLPKSIEEQHRKLGERINDARTAAR